jgi:hypothetical protein
LPRARVTLGVFLQSHKPGYSLFIAQLDVWRHVSLKLPYSAL